MYMYMYIQHEVIDEVGVDEAMTLRAIAAASRLPCYSFRTYCLPHDISCLVKLQICIILLGCWSTYEHV